MSYQDRCNLLKNKPVLVARHFHCKVEILFKEMILDGPLGNTEYCALQRDSPNVHSSVWIFNELNIHDETAYTEFIENTLNAQWPEPENEPGLFELVKTYQICSHSRTCWKYNKNECRFSHGRFFTYNRKAT